MNLKEIEQTASAYRLRIAEQERHSREITDRMAKENAERQQEETAIARGEVQTILKRLQVEEALEAIAADTERGWGEGKVVPIPHDPNYKSGYRFYEGVSLVSEPFPTTLLMPNPEGRGQVLQRAYEQARLSVRVGLPHRHSGEKAKVTVDDHPIYRVKDAKDIVLQDIIRQSGVNPGIEAAVFATKWTVSSGGYRVVSPEEEVGIGSLHSALLQTLELRDEFESRPKQIRSWREGVIAQLPERFQQTGAMHKEALRVWAHGIRRSNPITVFVDRMGYRFL